MERPVLIELVTDEKILGEIDQLPDRSDQFIILSHPKGSDGQGWTGLAKDVTQVLLPWSQIRRIQLLPFDDNAAVIGFVRD